MAGKNSYNNGSVGTSTIGKDAYAYSRFWDKGARSKEEGLFANEGTSTRPHKAKAAYLRQRRGTRAPFWRKVLS